MKKSIQCIILSWVAAGVAILHGLRKAKGLDYVVFGAAYTLLPAACAIILQVLYKRKYFH